MKVGITMSLHNTTVWSNGAQQNAIYLAGVLKKAGHEVTIITSIDPSDKQIGKEFFQICNDLGLKWIPIQDSLNKYFNVVITLGFWLKNDFISTYRSKNPNMKLVNYQCGNNFLIDTEHILFGAYENRFKDFEDYRYGEQPATPDQVWTIPQMENSNKDWYAYSTNCDNVTVVPFVWDPQATDTYRASNSYGDYVKRPITKIAVMEPNISVMKHYLPTLVTVEELLKRGHKIEKYMTIGTNHLAENKRALQLHRGKKIAEILTMNPRVPTQMIIHDFADLVLSWQWENHLNYLYLDLAWVGAPIVHNAEFCQDIGYYYEGFKVRRDAVAAVEKAMTEHQNDETYLERSKEAIKRYTKENQIMLDQYNILLDNLVKNNFVEMKYDWKTNSVSPINNN